jgi:hypothetical protein
MDREPSIALNKFNYMTEEYHLSIDTEVVLGFLASLSRV